MQKLIWKNANNEQIDLTTGSYGITEWEGFSNTSLNIQSQQVPFQDGGVFLDALIEQRELSVTLAMQDSGNLENRYRMRRELIHILNPKLGEGYLIYTNGFISKRIKCIPQIPLFENHNSNDSGTPKVSLSWTACQPYWEDLEETVVHLNNDDIIDVENLGDIPANIKLDVSYENDVENLYLLNLSNQKKIQVNGQESKPIHINTNIGQKEVYTQKPNINLLNGGGFDWFCESPDKLIFSNVYFDLIFDKFQNKTYNITNTQENSNLVKVIYNGNIYVKLFAGAIYTSSDGLSWIKRFSIVQHYMRDITYSFKLNKFIIVTGYAAGIIYTSSDGVNWTEVSLNLTYEVTLECICYSEELELFVIAGHDISDYTKIFTSSDGVNWTEQSSPSSSAYSFNYISYCKNLFILTGMHGIIFTSSDGENWTRLSNFTTTALQNSYYNEIDSKYYIGSTGKIFTSSDGENWTEQIVQAGETYISMMYSKIFKKLILLINKDSFRIMNNEDFIYYGFKAGAITDMISSNEKIYAMSFQGVIFVYEDENFTKLFDDSRFRFNEICLFENKLIVVGYVSTGMHGLIYTSSDNGVSWTETFRNSTSGTKLNSITYSPKLNKFIAAGEDGLIYISSDGMSWTEVNSGISYDINKVKWVNFLNKFIITVGYSGGIIYTSSDGENWTEVNLGVTSTGTSINNIVDNGEYVILTSSNLILKSTDGENWTNYTINLNTSTHIYRVIYVPELKIWVLLNNSNAVGINNDIYISFDCENWFLYFDAYCGEIVFNSVKNNFYCGGPDSIFINFENIKDENIINKISSDSDINLNLNIGNNKLRLDADSTNKIIGILTFRQKYIGV